MFSLTINRNRNSFQFKHISSSHYVAAQSAITIAAQAAEHLQRRPAHPGRGHTRHRSHPTVASVGPQAAEHTQRQPAAGSSGRSDQQRQQRQWQRQRWPSAHMQCHTHRQHAQRHHRRHLQEFKHNSRSHAHLCANNIIDSGHAATAHRESQPQPESIRSLVAGWLAQLDHRQCWCWFWCRSRSTWRWSRRQRRRQCCLHQRQLIQRTFAVGTATAAHVEQLQATLPSQQL